MTDDDKTSEVPIPYGASVGLRVLCLVTGAFWLFALNDLTQDSPTHTFKVGFSMGVAWTLLILLMPLRVSK